MTTSASEFLRPIARNARLAGKLSNYSCEHHFLFMFHCVNGRGSLLWDEIKNSGNEAGATLSLLSRDASRHAVAISNSSLPP